MEVSGWKWSKGFEREWKEAETGSADYVREVLKRKRKGESGLRKEVKRKRNEECRIWKGRSKTKVETGSADYESERGGSATRGAQRERDSFHPTKAETQLNNALTNVTRDILLLFPRHTAAPSLSLSRFFFLVSILSFFLSGVWSIFFLIISLLQLISVLARSLVTNFAL